MELTDKQKKQNKFTRDLTEISDETGISYDMVSYIYRCIKKCFASNKSANAQEITIEIIKNFVISEKDVDIAESLKNHNINSSSDIGLVVEAFCKKEIFSIEEGEEISDFDGLFESSNIDQFIQASRISKPKDIYRIISYIFYAIGVVLVVGSYMNLVPNNLAWFGWGIGMLGWVLLTFKGKLISVFNPSSKNEPT